MHEPTGVTFHAYGRGVDAGPGGLRVRTWLRRRHLPWDRIADFRIRVWDPPMNRAGPLSRVDAVLHDGRAVRLPEPLHQGLPGAEEFDEKVEALRALLRRYGAPGAAPGDRATVVTPRTGSRGVRYLAVLALLLLGAGVAGMAVLVPWEAERERSWESARPCTARTPSDEIRACLYTAPARIAEVHRPRFGKRHELRFRDGEPIDSLSVHRSDAGSFDEGEKVELTFFQGDVVRVRGDDDMLDLYSPGGSAAAVGATLPLLGGGYAAAQTLVRLRHRRLPEDEVRPSATLPFLAVAGVTALWLIPLAYLRPTTLHTSPVLYAGAALSLGLSALAWRTTGRTPAPGETRARELPAGEDVFVRARFLGDVPYNPYDFGTHVVLGAGPMAVVPHGGPGRFAAERIPAERLTVRAVRRARGADADVPGDWHVAELDDAGTPVRLAAAPADLALLVRELERAWTHSGEREPAPTSGEPDAPPPA